MMRNFVAWLRPSFESRNGRSSGRRLTAFVAVTVYVFGRVRYILRVEDAQWLLYGTISDAAFVLLLFGVITMQQLLEFKNIKKE